MEQGLFSDLKVIDAASFLAGPCAATILADYGADVVKIEPPKGDRHRSIAAGHPSDWSWQLTNRSKRSLALDIATDDGYAVLMKMIEQADVFLVNFSAGQLEKHRLTWETLKSVNPRLIFAQISAFGLEGKEADRKAFDLTGWFARTGILDMMRDKDVPPSMPAGGVGDHATAMTLYAGIVSALYRRAHTGEGSMVSTSLAVTGAWANGLNLQAVIGGIDNVARRNEEGWSNPVQNVFTTADDRHVLIAVQNLVRDFDKLVDALEMPEWRDMEDMQPVKPLFRNRVKARQRIALAIRAFDAAELHERLEKVGIVHELIRRNDEVLEDEQLIANGLIVPFDSGRPGCDRTFASPFQISGETQRVPVAAPDVGEQTDELLAEFGFDTAEVARLRERGVVGSRRKAN